jgi:hypothetical protein
MQKLFITTMLLTCLLSSSLNAQKKGLLGRLGDKLEQAAAEGANANLEKELKKDIEATVLEGKPIHKDSRGISGIYYSHLPIRIGINGTNNYNYARKFLFKYVEGDNANQIQITTRYNYTTKADLSALIYTPKAGTPDYFPITTSIKLGKFLIDGAQNTHAYAAESNLVVFPKEGEPKINQTVWTFNIVDILELEPGIFIATYLEDIINANTPSKYKFLQENATYMIFYKKEKEEKAMSMSKEKVWDELKVFYTKYYAAFKAAEGSNVDLIKPIAKFAEEPTNADLVATVKARIQQMPHLTEDLVYLYPVTQWQERYENIGILGRTLTHRVMQVQAILKQGSEYKVNQFMIRQDNSYQAGSSIRKFTGNPVKAIGDTERTVISADKALKYKK